MVCYAESTDKLLNMVTKEYTFEDSNELNLILMELSEKFSDDNIDLKSNLPLTRAFINLEQNLVQNKNSFKEE